MKLSMLNKSEVIEEVDELIRFVIDVFVDEEYNLILTVIEE